MSANWYPWTEEKSEVEPKGWYAEKDDRWHLEVWLDYDGTTWMWDCDDHEKNVAVQGRESSLSAAQRAAEDAYQSMADKSFAGYLRDLNAEDARLAGESQS